jgi:hypothetical protein
MKLLKNFNIQTSSTVKTTASFSLCQPPRSSNARAKWVLWSGKRTSGLTKSWMDVKDRKEKLKWNIYDTHP